MSRLTIEESCRIAILKKLEEVGKIENSGYSGSPSSKMVSGFVGYWGDRADVARQAITAHDKGEELVGHPSLDDPAEG